MRNRLTNEDVADIRRQAAALNSDGCSGPTEVYRVCCLEHDICYRTGRTFRGDRTTRREADARFRQCMQDYSKLGRLSGVAIGRWILVRLFGRGKHDIWNPPPSDVD